MRTVQQTIEQVFVSSGSMHGCTNLLLEDVERVCEKGWGPPLSCDDALRPILTV